MVHGAVTAWAGGFLGQTKNDYMSSVFICSIKILGFPFAVLTKDEADRWVAQDPEMHCYSEIPVKAVPEA